MTKIHRLSRDVSVMFNGGGDPAQGYEVKAKAGTVLVPVPGGMGVNYAIPPHACDAGNMGKAGTWSIFGHDSTYHHVFAPADAIEAVEG